MGGHILIKGHLQITLPLKSSPSIKQQKRHLVQDDDSNLSQEAQKWRTPNPGVPTHAMLSLKKRAHQHYKRRAQQRVLSFHPSPTQMQSPVVDPFSTWPIQPTPDVPRMARYFVQSWAPEHGCAFAIEGHPNPYLSLLWPFAMQDDMYFEALISVCLATWLPSQGISVKQDRMFVYHRSNVVTKLRQRLQSPDRCCDNATILTVASLGTIDYITGEHEAAGSHVEGMRRMINMRGGIQGNDSMEQLVKINVAAYESLWSFVTECSTPTEEKHFQQAILQKGQLPTYMSHPFKPEVCELLANLPGGFCDLGLQGTFSVQMIKILSALNHIAPEQAATDQQSPLTPESSPSSSSETSSFNPNSLLDLIGDIQRLASLHTTLTEHLLCHGLLAYGYILRYLYLNVSFDAFYSSALDILKQKSIRHTPDTEDLDKDCYLWSSIMIGTALMNIISPLDSRFAVFDHLMSAYPECQDWDVLVATTNRFFWQPELEAMVRRSWEETMHKLNAPPQANTVSIKTEEASRPSRMKIRDVIL